MSHIPVAGGIMGLVFAAGVTAIFLIGVPLLRWVLVASVPLGLIIAAVLYFWHKRKPVELSGLDDETRIKLD
jgi:hypothetical protein